MYWGLCVVCVGVWYRVLEVCSGGIEVEEIGIMWDIGGMEWKGCVGGRFWGINLFLVVLVDEWGLRCVLLF